MPDLIDTPTRTSVIGYDAGMDSGARSVLIFPQNSRVEYNRWTRRRLVERSRAIEANFTFVTRLKRKYGRRTAGRGIFPTPTTRDVAWNAIVKPIFEAWASNPFTYSVDASRDMWEDQRYAAEELGAGDGESITVLARRDGPDSPLMTQALDVYEVESPWGLSLDYLAVDPRLYEDGVRCDEWLRPLAYSVRTLPSPIHPWPLAWREIPADSLIHVFNRRRAKQFRGLPPLYSGLNTANDAMDLTALDTQTAKLHALLGVKKIVKPQNGGSGVGIGSQLTKILDQNGNVARLEEFLQRGAVTVECNEGEDIELLTSTRPTSAIIEGVRSYCGYVALGADLPLSVVYDFAGVGGTAVRADMEDAQDTFDMRQDQIVWRHSQPIYVRKLADMMQRGEIPRCQDPYFWRSDWHGPAKMTTDYGRSAAANIDLMKSGLLCAPRYFDERGQDAYDEGRKQIDWLAAMKAYCAAKGVDFNLFFEPTPGAQTKINVQQPDSANS